MQLNLLESFAEFKEFKNVDKETLMAILEEVFRNMIIKKYGSDENFDIIINPEKGDLEIWRNREIVEDGEVEDVQKLLADEGAMKAGKSLKISLPKGDKVTIEWPVKP
ncbi:MAG: NusA N-terminal domain-containing protein [Flavobacteriales bacterium]|nr:NusA N-terminal domain-containing protein [Flavobacteriales bacterium]